jgi:hypothetical protein
MRSFSGITVIFILVMAFFACNSNNKSLNRRDLNEADTIDNTPDSIVKYFSSQRLLKEVSFKNGVRNGLTKTYYPGGQLYQTFWYRHDLREDSSGWYYLEGQLYRSTPYVHDTIQGIQRQYYRNGNKKARIGFDKGLRTEFFEEFTADGKLVSNYPELTVSVTDEYKTRGSYTITLNMSDNSKNAKFYKGEFIEGRYDTTKYTPIKTVDGIGKLVLKKTGATGNNYVGVIGSFLTNFQNRKLVYKKIELPYNDLH